MQGAAYGVVGVLTGRIAQPHHPRDSEEYSVARACRARLNVHLTLYIRITRSPMLYISLTQRTLSRRCGTRGDNNSR